MAEQDSPDNGPADEEQEVGKGFHEMVRAQARAVFSEEFRAEMIATIVPAINEAVKTHTPTLEEIAQATAPIVIREFRTSARQEIEDARAKLRSAAAEPVKSVVAEVSEPTKTTNIVEQISTAAFEILSKFTELERVRKFGDNPLALFAQLKKDQPEMFDFAVTKYSVDPAANFEERMWEMAPGMMRRWMEEEGIQDIRGRRRDGDGRSRSPLGDSPGPGEPKNGPEPKRNGATDKPLVTLTEDNEPATADTTAVTATPRGAGRTRLRDLA